MFMFGAAEYTLKFGRGMFNSCILMFRRLGGVASLVPRPEKVAGPGTRLGNKQNIG